MNRISRYLLLSFVSIAIVFVAFIVVAKPAQAGGCGGDDKGNFNNSGEINCGNEEYKYDPISSQALGHPVFVESRFSQTNPDNRTYLVICSATTGKLRTFASGGASCGSGGNDISFENYSNASLDYTCSTARGGSSGCSGTEEFCSINKPTNCIPWNGSGYQDYGIPGTGREGPRCSGKPCRYTGAAPPGLSELRDQLQEQADLEAQQSSCEDRLNSPLSFVMCPVMNFMTSAITSVVEGLQTALTNPDLTQSTQLADALRSMINIANSFYIIIFIVIIIGNFVAIPGMDNYTIKKTLPKLIAAIILTQFSLLICQAILDFGNVLAVTLPTTLLRSFGINGTPPQAFANAVTGSPNTTPPQPGVGNLGDLFESIGQFFMLLIVLLAGIIVGIIAFFYLVMRYFFIVLLVLATPFAFAAWVLPNTEQFFKKWWNMFIKLSLMYLLVTLLFTGGAIFSLLLLSGNIFGSNGGENFLSSLVGIFIPLVVLALVPKTLKVSGEIMAKGKEAVQKGYQGAKDSYAGKKISKSAQEGKIAETKGKGYEKFGQALGGKKGARLEAKGRGLQDRSKEQLKKDVGALSLDRQIELSRQGGAVGKEAASAVNKRKQELLNTRILDEKGAKDLKAIGAMPTIGYGSDGKPKVNEIYNDSRLGQAREGEQNPFWNAGGGPPPTSPTGGSGSSSTGSSIPSGIPGGTTSASGTPGGARNRRTGTRTPFTPPAPTGGATPPTPGSSIPGGTPGGGAGGGAAGGAAGGGVPPVPPV